MAKLRTIQILRGTTAQNNSYTGAAGELTMDTTLNEVRIHDGSTAGGHIVGSGGGGAVSSVNGKTGAVVLDATDVGAIPSSTSIPTTLAALTGDVAISSPSNGQYLVYDNSTGKWKNATATPGVAWGSITGTLSNQTDLQTALSGKQDTLTAGNGISITSNTVSVDNLDCGTMS